MRDTNGELGGHLERDGAADRHVDLGAAAANSADALEIAAVLEAEGINDRIARERYGATDVFSLAAALLRDRPDPTSPTQESVTPTTGTAAGRRAADRTTNSDRSRLAGGWNAGATPVTAWLWLRGMLYVVPALVSLSLLRATDGVEAALLLGGLAASWAFGNGMAYLGWVLYGNLDPAGTRRFMHRQMLLGIAGAAAVSVVAVYVALYTTTTVHVTLGTIVLLTGQTAYQLSAVTLLMLGHDRWLLIALIPAALAAMVGLASLHSHELAGHGTAAAGSGAMSDRFIGGPLALAAVALSILLALAFALVSTRNGAPPLQRLHPAVWRGTLMHTCYGLLTALLLLYPAITDLSNDNFESLSLSVTLAAVPLVFSMGMAEVQLHRHRRISARLLTFTASPVIFAQIARRAYGRTHLEYLTVLAVLTVVFGIASATLWATDGRGVLLCINYLLIGGAIFMAMVLVAMGDMGLVLATFSAAVAFLIIRAWWADYTVTDTAAVLWHGAVGAALFAVCGVLVLRKVSQPVNHWLAR